MKTATPIKTSCVAKIKAGDVARIPRRGTFHPISPGTNGEMQGNPRNLALTYWYYE